MEVIEIITVTLVGLFIAYFFLASKKETENFAYIDEYKFHDGVLTRFKKTRPELTLEEVNTVVLALKDYFKIHHRAGKKFLSMPSQVVDDLWHEFILFTKEYETFCKGAVGHYLHHVPSEAMQDQKVASTGIQNTWKYACALEAINPQNPTKLPRLFLLDSKYKIPNGFYYTRNCNSSSGSGYCASHIGDSSDLDDGHVGSDNSDIGNSCGSSCGGGD